MLNNKDTNIGASVCVYIVHVPIKAHSFYFFIFFKVQYKQQNETHTLYFLVY